MGSTVQPLTDAALYGAVLRGQVHVVEHLMTTAQVHTLEFSNKVTGHNAVTLAAEMGCSDALRLLLLPMNEKRSEWANWNNAQTGRGAISYALQVKEVEKRHECIRILMEAGALPFTAIYWRKTVYMPECCKSVRNWHYSGKKHPLFVLVCAFRN